VKLGKLASRSFEQSFKQLVQNNKIPVKTGFKLKGIIKVVGDEVTKYRALITDYAREYSVKDEQGNPKEEIRGVDRVFTIDLTRKAELDEKIRELDGLDVDLPNISVSELGNAGDLSISPDDLFNLEFITE
jgi:hypothetical protein